MLQTPSTAHKRDGSKSPKATYLPSLFFNPTSTSKVATKEDNFFKTNQKDSQFSFRKDESSSGHVSHHFSSEDAPPVDSVYEILSSPDRFSRAPSTLITRDVAGGRRGSISPSRPKPFTEETEEQNDNDSYPSVIHKCVVVYGYPSWAISHILQDFQSLGEILRYKSPNLHESNNWLLIEFENTWQAKKAISSRNAKVMMNGAFMIGVVPLINAVSRVPQALEFVYESVSNLEPSSRSENAPQPMDISPLFKANTAMMSPSPVQQVSAAPFASPRMMSPAAHQSPTVSVPKIYPSIPPQTPRQNEAIRVQSPTVLMGGVRGAKAQNSSHAKSVVGKAFDYLFGW